MSRLGNLPAEPGVYVAVDSANRVWYAGIADSIRECFANHDRLSDFGENGVTAVAWTREDSPIRRRRFEAELIEYYRPTLNAEADLRSLSPVDIRLTSEEEIERFLRLRIQQKLIELEIELLKPNIVALCEQAATGIHHRLGVIHIQSRKSWEYSENLERMKELLKAMQQAGREDGSARVKSATVFPVVRLNASTQPDRLPIALGRIENQRATEFVF